MALLFKTDHFLTAPSSTLCQCLKKEGKKDKRIKKKPQNLLHKATTNKPDLTMTDCGLESKPAACPFHFIIIKTMQKNPAHTT